MSAINVADAAAENGYDQHVIYFLFYKSKKKHNDDGVCCLAL
jgi:hypothetical protein